MNVLLTGAFGNVGAHVITALSAQGHRVTCFDVETKHNRKVEARLRRTQSFDTVWGDLTKAELVREAVSKARPDAIVHVAAIIAPLAYVVPAKAYAVNVTGTRNLLDAAKGLEAPPRFVFTSSYTVHGPRNPYRNLPPLTGSTPVDPRDTYGCHKVTGERMVAASGLPFVVLRLPFVWATDPEWGRDPAFLKFAFLLPPERKAHGIDVRDAALALANAVTRDVVGRTFEIAGGDGWKGTSAELVALSLAARGLGSIPDSAFRMADPDVDDAWYFEDHVDTTESQAALDYQKHSVADYSRTIWREAGLLGPVMKLLSPAIVAYIRRQSPYSGRPRIADGTPLWARVAEAFGIDPAPPRCDPEN